DTANHEHRAPSKARDQAGGENAAERSPDREAAEHDHHHGGAAALRIVFGRQRDGVGHGAAKAEPGEETDQQKRADVLGEGGRKRAGAERGGRKNDDLLAPDPVSERPEHQRTDHETKQAGAEDGSQRPLGQMPFLRKRRRDIADRLGVETVKEQYGGASEQQPDLEAADRLAVDEVDEIDRRRAAGLRLISGHGRPPPLAALAGRLLLTRQPIAPRWLRKASLV